MWDWAKCGHVVCGESHCRPGVLGCICGGDGDCYTGCAVDEEAHLHRPRWVDVCASLLTLRAI